MLIKSVIDSGRITALAGFLQGPEERPDPEDHHDQHGHGTHITRLMLKMAPSAEILVAKIANGPRIALQHLHRIERAIRWATDHRVHIIFLSFGLDEPNAGISGAIRGALREDIAIFAAAANHGGNKQRAYPASRDSVLCIHACDGLGNNADFSPSALERGDNFSTLGVAVPSRWKKQTVHVSGTSYAVPLAAAFVANVLAFARCRCRLTSEQEAGLRGYHGATRILRLMVQPGAKPRDSYDYVAPEYLWDERKMGDQVAKDIVACAQF